MHSPKEPENLKPTCIVCPDSIVHVYGQAFLEEKNVIT